ncbi:hypothetical protein GCM10007160_26900 [Litchfieldella qijiaojingensis]|uniref:Transposase n=1 Tax=Litchfieldella qijiaojingensis TaxID=980347 RepID=A0ABQ2YYS5_9GAMM|nr:hypothetical protein GCM10007160_26900 [Halomonas qijiaojingensis]
MKSPPASSGKAARKFKATTTSRHTLPVALNLLEQDFTAEAPNQKWVGDIVRHEALWKRAVMKEHCRWSVAADR